VTPERRAALAALQERELPDEEARRYLDAPMEPAEREAILDLVRWFRSRYPTPADRLAYVRRAYRRWSAGRR
jgi:hypothetical protein